MDNLAFANEEFREDEFPATAVSSWPGNGSWIPEVRTRLQELTTLKSNWDSYGSSQIDGEVAQGAFELLQHVMEDDSPIPWIVPTSTGGVQIEWNVNDDCFIEVEVVRRTLYEVYSQMPGDDPVEFDIQFDVSPLQDSLDRLKLVTA